MTGINSSLNKPTLLAVGLFVPGNGFTRVFETLFTKLSEHYTVHWLGIGYKGKPVERENNTLHPCNINGGDIYGAYGAAALAAELNAKTVLLLNDFYLLKNYEQAWLPLKKRGVRLTAYVPLDGYIQDTTLMKDCFFLDELVLYNQWALSEVQAAIQNFRMANPSVHFHTPRLHFIYHGVDTGTFRPVADKFQKKIIKEKLFHVPGAGDVFFILNANRYNERKDIETTITAFAKALPHLNKTTCLCLHTPGLAPSLKSKLTDTVNNSGCSERIILNPLGEEYADETTLVKLYQACDAGVNTSLGEGWGLISFEHAACGAAQIVPDHTAPSEVWKGAGILINKEKPVKLHSNPFLMYATNSEMLTDELVRLVNDQSYLDDISRRCSMHAAGDQFNWDNIALQWLKILQAHPED